MKKNFKYAVACPTSMGIRLTPVNRMQMPSSDMFYMRATSAESNVLNVASSLGYECLTLTKFVKGSPISDFIRRDLRARNIRYEGQEVDAGGPWGYRHQINIADSGFGVRGARVWNDRAGEVGRVLHFEDFDVERIFRQEGVGIFHISGLIAAMSDDTTKCCIQLAQYAREHGTLVSFDLNYRDSFWVGRQEQLRSAFRQIADSSDILVGNEEDFQLCLGLKGPKTGGKELDSQIDGFKDMIIRAKEAFPRVQVFATTLREVISANENFWGAILYAGGNWYVEKPRSIGVMDRIGGGDGFTGGLLYGIIKGWEPEKWLHFGWATGAMAVTSLNDYAEPQDEAQVWAIYNGNARIER